MSGNSRIFVGRVAGVFGIKGWVKIRSETQPAENIFSYSPLWLVSGKDRNDRQIEIDRWQHQSKGLVAHIVGIDDRNMAEELKGSELLIEQQQLPELPEGEFYWHQLEGLQVISIQGEAPVKLGRVDRVMETGANDVLIVKPCEGSLDQRERLIPWLLDQVVVNVDLDRSTMEVDWDPEF